MDDVELAKERVRVRLEAVVDVEVHVGGAKDRRGELQVGYVEGVYPGCRATELGSQLAGPYSVSQGVG